MIQFFVSGGLFMWLILVLFLVNLMLTTKIALDLNGGQPVDMVGIHAILFIGVSCVWIGMFGQILGLFEGFKEIIIASDVSPAIVRQGFSVSYHPTIFGFVICLLSVIAWFVLYRRAKGLQLAA